MDLDEGGKDRVRFRLDRLDAIINRNAILRHRFFVRDRGHGCNFGIRGVAMLTAIVVLHLVVHDCDTGTLLYEARRVMPSYANSIEACRRTGVEKARARHEIPQGLSQRLHQRRLRMGARRAPHRTRLIGSSTLFYRCDPT